MAQSLAAKASARAVEAARLLRKKRVGVWLSEHPEGVTKPLILEQTYTLNIKVGLPVSGTLAAGSETIIQQSDIPNKGLDTEWEVISQTLRLASKHADTKIETKTLGGKTIWTARFRLAIPKQGESATVQFQATPFEVGEAGLDILVYVRGELYRQLTVRLDVTDLEELHLCSTKPDEEVTAYAPQPILTAHAPQPILTTNIVHAAAEHLNLRPAHEWQTPPGELNISVIGNGLAFVTGEAGGQTVGEATQWFAAPAKIAGSIENVGKELERFRMKWEKYLNDINPADLARRLENPPRPYDWETPFVGEEADAAHQQAWEQAAVSAELRNLAYAGHTLFEEIFPYGEDLRGWVGSLPPGHRINIFWQESAGADYVAHIPWGLLYLPDPPDPGSPVDALGFWGLRFRTEYRAHAVPGGSKALGGPQTAFCTFALYWGEGDEVGTESVWQRQEWQRYRNQNLIPVGAVRKTEVLTAFSRPQPEPTAVVYFFCHCSVGEGNDPVLRFGSTKAEEDNIRRTDFSVKLLDSNPLVFANACTTSTADAYMANDLEQSFFRRGCRAFVGTEAKVPITLASRFASIFFRYFLREIAPEPMAGGEAMAQTRLFLWNQYRNIGGLFYAYINQYELYFADDAEVKQYRL